jgi:hypothetical protein
MPSVVMDIMGENMGSCDNMSAKNLIKATLAKHNT